jgi:hypothetical protein
MLLISQSKEKNQNIAYGQQRRKQRNYRIKSFLCKKDATPTKTQYGEQNKPRKRKPIHVVSIKYAWIELG